MFDYPKWVQIPGMAGITCWNQAEEEAYYENNRKAVSEASPIHTHESEPVVKRRGRKKKS